VFVTREKRGEEKKRRGDEDEDNNSYEDETILDIFSRIKTIQEGREKGRIIRGKTYFIFHSSFLACFVQLM
jgi:hypothetical protein